MRLEDKQYLDEHAKRIDERHENLVNLMKGEFAEISKYMSKQNDRVTIIEHGTRFARWVQNKPRAALFSLFGVVVLFVIVANVFSVGELLRMWIFKV